MNETIEVRHEPAARRFVAELDGYSGHVAYDLAEGIMTIQETRVATELRGRGLAGHLTRAAADWARAESLKVQPSCSYAARWFEHHPGDADLLA